MLSAVSILRVSTKKQLNEGDGIENQRRANDAYIERQKYRKVKEIVLAESANLDIAERCDLDAALRTVLAMKRKGLVDVVVLYKSDRLSRGGGEQYYPIKALLRGHGLKLEFSTEHIDDSASGELLEHVLTGIARFENRVRVDRTVGVEKILTKEGYWCRPAPTGFVNARDVYGKPTLAPTPDKRQWELLTEGLKKQLSGLYRTIDIVNELSEKGLVTRSGKPVFKQTWQNICRSPVYGGLLCGVWTDGKYVRAKFDGPLTPSEWHELQRVLDGKTRLALVAPRQQLREDLPLRRFLRCPECDKTARGYASINRAGNRFLYYDCRHSACGFRAGADTVHADFLNLLRDLTPSPELLHAFRELILDAWQDRTKTLRSEETATRKSIEALKLEKRSILDLMKKSQDDAVLLGELRQDFDKVERELSLKAVTAERPAVASYDAEAVVGHCTHLLQNIVELWPKWPVQAKSQVQRLVFPAGVSYAEIIGCRTPRLSPVYAVFRGPNASTSKMALPTGRVTNQDAVAHVDLLTNRYHFSYAQFFKPLLKTRKDHLEKGVIMSIDRCRELLKLPLCSDEQIAEIRGTLYGLALTFLDSFEPVSQAV